MGDIRANTMSPVHSDRIRTKTNIKSGLTASARLALKYLTAREKKSGTEGKALGTRGCLCSSVKKS